MTDRVTSDVARSSHFILHPSAFILSLMSSRTIHPDTLRWQKFPVLDDGFVCLVDVMGDDQAVVQAARVSYGEGTRKVSDDRGLDPLFAAAPPHDAVRDGRDQAAGPRADGLLAAMDSSSHGQRERIQHPLFAGHRRRRRITPARRLARKPGHANRQGSGDPLTADAAQRADRRRSRISGGARQVIRRADRRRRGSRASPQGSCRCRLTPRPIGRSICTICCTFWRCGWTATPN